MVKPVPDNPQPDAAKRRLWLSIIVALVLGLTLILYLLVSGVSTDPAPSETPAKTLPPDSSVLLRSQEDAALIATQQQGLPPTPHGRQWISEQ